MTPATSVQAETARELLHIEGRGEQVGLAQGTANLEFLADGERLLRTHYLEFPDAAALASLQRDEVGDQAEVVFQFAVDEFGEFCLG